MNKIYFRQWQVKLVVLICWGMIALFSTMIGGKTWADAADYAGIYGGTYEGDDEGIWTAEFQTNGALQMIIWSKNYSSGFSSAGTVNMNGVFFALNTDQGFSADGAIDAQSGVTGTWNWSQMQMQGDFEGRKSGATEYQEYVGTYSGNYSGDYDGTVKICIQADGRLAGQSYNPEYNVREQLTGAFVNNTEVLAYSDKSMAFYAVLDSGVTLTGTWYRADDDTSGVFQLVKTSETPECNFSDSGGGGGGGGGGGCYIETAAHKIYSRILDMGRKHFPVSSVSFIFLVCFIACLTIKKRKSSAN